MTTRSVARPCLRHLKTAPLLLVVVSAVLPLAALDLAGGALAQDKPSDNYLDPDEPDGATDDDVIVVTGARPAFTPIEGVAPAVTFNSADIRAFGAGSIADLLEAAEAETQSSGSTDRPLLLLNGRRISGYQEIQNFPPEAIQRMEILPEEAASRYGASPDQRVVNFVLRPRFRAVTVEQGIRTTTEGGGDEYETDLNILRIRNERRWNVDLGYIRRDALLESERNVVNRDDGRLRSFAGNIEGRPSGSEIDPALSALAGEPVFSAAVPVDAASGELAVEDFLPGANAPLIDDLRDYRMLLPETDEVEVGATYFLPINEDMAITFSGNGEFIRTDRTNGLGSVRATLPADSPFNPFGDAVLLNRYDGFLTRESEQREIELRSVLASEHGSWRWDVIGQYSHADNDSVIALPTNRSSVQERIEAGDPDLNPFGPLGIVAEDTSNATTNTAMVEANLSGEVFELSGTDVVAGIYGAALAEKLEARATRQGVSESNELSRNTLTTRANISLPFVGDGEAQGSFGRVDLSLNSEYSLVTDTDGLAGFGSSLVWRPPGNANFRLSFNRSERAPSLQQLGDPVSISTNVSVFDFQTGRSVGVDRRSGGNPDLKPETRDVLRLGVNFVPISNLSVSSTYTDIRTKDDLSPFPVLTPDIQGAFPERFQRDADGILQFVDITPVNFAMVREREIRTGLNWRVLLDPQSSRRGDNRVGDAGGSRQNSERRTLRQGEQAEEIPDGPSSGRAAESGGPAQGDGGGDPGGVRAAGSVSPAGGRAGNGGRGGGGGRANRMLLSVYHTWTIENEVQLTEGGAILNLLEGDAVRRQGGQPEHEVSARLNLLKNGFGAEMRYDWEAETFIASDALANNLQGAGDLTFSSLSTVNLELFADLGARQSLVEQYPWLRGSRIALEVRNVFDEKQDVRDGNGKVPLTFQADELDPRGRFIEISFRKVFPRA